VCVRESNQSEEALAREGEGGSAEGRRARQIIGQAEQQPGRSSADGQARQLARSAARGAAVRTSLSQITSVKRSVEVGPSPCKKSAAEPGP